MSETNDTYGPFAGGHVVIVNGVEYTLTDATQELQGKYEAWLEARNLAAVMSLKNKIPEKDYQALLFEHVTRKEANHWRWNGPGFLESAEGPQGYARLVAILLQPKHPGITDAEVKDLLKAEPLAFRMAVWKILGLSLPNSSGPSSEKTTDSAQSNGMTQAQNGKEMVGKVMAPMEAAAVG